MLFERFDTKNRKGFIKNLIKYLYFLSKVHLDHPELYSGVDIFWVILNCVSRRQRGRSREAAQPKSVRFHSLPYP